MELADIAFYYRENLPDDVTIESTWLPDMLTGHPPPPFLPIPMALLVYVCLKN